MASKPHILIVEDEAIVAMELERRLTGLGYEVAAVVGGGEEAVQEAVRSQPELILMDIKLKGEMDGIEAAEQIQERLSVPIIYLTAYGNETAVGRAKATAPFGYIMKPFHERELQISIEIALYKHQMEVEQERFIQELQEALSTIKTLRGIIPICSSCKKIRDDEGYWQQVEVYVRDHTEADFTHSLCPDCARQLFPEIDQNDKI